MPGTDHLVVIDEALEDAARVKQGLRTMAPDILRIAKRIAESFAAGGHLYACGNGGSACDAMHLTEELVARYKRDRPGLPAHHMMDGATLTCWSNDYDFEGIFARQVEAMARPGDILIALSTSGNSPNVLRAAEAAVGKGMVVIGLTGAAGGRLKDMCSDCLIVPSAATERIQEGHIVVIHLLCELIEEMLFGTPTAAWGRR